MMQPLLLDIGCCQGAATYGYQRAGFRVMGVDIVDQPRWRKRFGDHNFLRADGLKVLRDAAFMSRFAAVHASWPCQGYTECQRIQGNDHPMLIEPGRELLMAWAAQTGGVWVMENVKGAPLKNPIQLCGASFGLRTHRHRLFESNIPLTGLGPCPAPHQTQVKMGRPLREGDWYQAVGNFSGVEYVRRDMGLSWMNRDGLRECFPWQMAEYVGRQLMQAVA